MPSKSATREGGRSGGTTPGPRPCRYCAVNCGYWFPDLSAGRPDRYRDLAIVKKHLCMAVARAGIPCDPGHCQSALAGAREPAQLVVATKQLWGQYYEEAYGAGKTRGGAFDDILDELGF